MDTPPLQSSLASIAASLAEMTGIPFTATFNSRIHETDPHTGGPANPRGSIIHKGERTALQKELLKRTATAIFNACKEEGIPPGFGWRTGGVENVYELYMEESYHLAPTPEQIAKIAAIATQVAKKDEERVERLRQNQELLENITGYHYVFDPEKRVLFTAPACRRILQHIGLFGRRKHYRHTIRWLRRRESRNGSIRY